MTGLLVAFFMHPSFRIIQRPGQSLFTQFEDSPVWICLFHDSLPFSIIFGCWLHSLIPQDINTVGFLSEYRDRRQYYLHFSSDNFFSESACLISSPEPSRYCFLVFCSEFIVVISRRAVWSYFGAYSAIAEGHQHFFSWIMKHW